MHQWALYHLVTLSSPKKTSKIQQLVQKAYSALEAFGHAKNTVNDNASRFGKYLELQFNERGRMIGAKFLDYMLEKSRVTHTSGDERNFHIFYYILHGSSSEEKSMLHLGEPSTYHYLFRTKEAARLAGAPTIVVEDTEKYMELKALLKSLGINKTTWTQMTQIIAAILHLGNIQFIDDSTNQQDSAIVKNTVELDMSADLLGVEPKSLETCLTYQTKLIKRDLTTIFLNAEQAALQRDALVEALYSLLFSWLVEMFNKKLCKSDFQNFIGIVDFPGAEPIQVGTYDQFCVHYANERLQDLMMKQVFGKNEQIYTVFNQTPPIMPTNEECLTLLTDPQNGIIASLSQPVADHPERCVDAFKQANRKNTHLGSKTVTHSAETHFTIQHFTGLVAYSPTDFGNRTTETLCTDFMSLFGSKMDDAPTNGLLTKIFSQKAIAVETHPKSTNVVSGQQLAKPHRSPSVRHKGGNSTKVNMNQNSSKAGQLAEAVQDILSTLEAAKTWFVVCFRSNDLLLPHSCDSKKLTVQVKTFHLLSLTVRARYEYTIKMDLSEFCERYADLIHATTVDLDAEPRDKWSALQEALHWNEKMMILDNEEVTDASTLYIMIQLKQKQKIGISDRDGLDISRK
jgi:chitin synthase